MPVDPVPLPQTQTGRPEAAWAPRLDEGGAPRLDEGGVAFDFRPVPIGERERAYLTTNHPDIPVVFLDELRARFPGKRFEDVATLAAGLLEFRAREAARIPPEKIFPAIKAARRDVNELFKEIARVRQDRDAAAHKTKDGGASTFTSGHARVELKTKLDQLINSDTFRLKDTLRECLRLVRDISGNLDGEHFPEGSDLHQVMTQVMVIGRDLIRSGMEPGTVPGLLVQLYDKLFGENARYENAVSKEETIGNIDVLRQKISKLVELSKSIYNDGRLHNLPCLEKLTSITNLFDLRRLLDALDLAPDSGQSHAELAESVAAFEELLEATFKLLNVHNNSGIQENAVDFIEDFAALGKGLAKLRCEINIAELLGALPSSAEDSENEELAALSQSLADATSEGDAAKALEVLKGGEAVLKEHLSEERGERLTNKIEELKHNVRLTELNDEIAKREDERIGLAGKAANPEGPYTEVDLDQLEQLSRKFPGERVASLAVILANYPDMNFEELTALRKNIADRDLERNGFVSRNDGIAAKMSPEDLANIVGGLDLTKLRYLARQAPGAKIRDIADVWRKNPDMDTDIEEVLRNDPDADIQRILEVKMRLRNNSIIEIADVLRQYPELNDAKAEEFIRTFPDEALEQIAYVLRASPNLDAQRLSKALVAFPDSRRRMYLLLRDYPDFNIDKAAEIKQVFRDAKLRDIARVLRWYPEIDRDRAAEVRAVFPEATLIDIARMLRDYPDFNAARAAEVRARFCNESLTDIARVLRFDPEFDPFKAALDRIGSPRNSLIDTAIRLRTPPGGSPHDHAAMLRFDPNFDAGKAAEVAKNFPGESRVDIAEVLRLDKAFDATIAAKVKAACPDDSLYTIAMVLRHYPAFDAAKLEEFLEERHGFSGGSLQAASILDRAPKFDARKVALALEVFGDKAFGEILAVCTHFPDFNAQKLGGVRAHFPNERPIDIARVLHFDPDFNPTEAAKIREAGSDLNLLAIAYRLRRRREAEAAAVRQDLEDMESQSWASVYSGLA